MSKKTLTREEAFAILWEEVEGVRHVRDKMVERSRWSIHYELIYEQDGRLWMMDYARGATEMQDGQDEFHYAQKIEVVEVKEAGSIPDGGIDG